MHKDDSNPFAVAFAAFAEGHPGPKIDVETGYSPLSPKKRVIDREVQAHLRRKAEED